ncbi:MAG TPA: carboxylating nicotinate-nucleotide diphosphorylase [candidate division Zixibacteria bacterium]|nr:carboxylating nicotinate-nucleotide diphosphorylase [candidate division Zixibacteria bacterium]
MEFPIAENKTLVEIALAEDIGGGDATSLALVPESARLSARIIAKGEGILCGGPAVEQVFALLDERVRVGLLLPDGTAVFRGDVVAEIDGPARSVLSGERTAMNFLCRLSGVATTANAFAERLSGTACEVLDTRKTTPGMRAVEKYAVAVGGGGNHRFGLWDMILVKENHIASAGGFRHALEKLFGEGAPALPVEVEVRNLEELEIALEYPVDRIMLDNFIIPQIERAIDLRTLRGANIPFEVSGNITLDSCRAIAETGVEFISSGAMTHSAPAMDFSMIATIIHSRDEAL